MCRRAFTWTLMVVAAATAARAQTTSVTWDVTVEQGTVRGYRSPSGNYFSFLGIPYATAPTGPYRFQGPLVAPHWEGVLESKYDDVLCPQAGGGEEQCLVLNVFAPNEAKDAPSRPLPVLVYVHGGTFLLGGGPTYGAGNLLDHGIIVVTFNYRIGALGFLCLGTERVPGNAGMKDQVAALRWVARNIAGFGGDPGAVTVYGTSAGGASVDLLILSNATDGLFHQAILESGSALLPWTVDRNPIQTAKDVARLMDFTEVENLSLLTDFYKQASSRALAAASVVYYGSKTDATFSFGPCVETPSASSFLTEDPRSILKNGNYEPVPVLAAYCNMEGFFRAPEFYEKSWRDRMEANFSFFLPGDLQFFSEEERSRVSEEVKRVYFGAGAVTEETVRSYLDYFGDTTFFYGILRSATLHALSSKPVYLMEFSYEGLLNQEKPHFSYVRGAGHSDINSYVFRDFRPTRSSDVTAVNRITMMWASFIKHGEPTPRDLQLTPVKWTPLGGTSDVSYLSFGDRLSMSSSPACGRVPLWDELYDRHYWPASAPAAAEE